MRVQLNLFERLGLLGLLPQKADYITLKIITNLQQQLSLSEEEFKEFGFKEVTQGNGPSRFEWNEKGRKPKEFEIGDKVKEIIVSKLKELSDAGELMMELFSLYTKFIEEKTDGNSK